LSQGIRCSAGFRMDLPWRSGEGWGLRAEDWGLGKEW
jgi:hypothetical protein